MFRCYFFFLLLVYNTEGNLKAIKCPDYCQCDVFESLRRATCQNKMLYSIEIDMPFQVEVLDLSNNQISELGKNIFLEIGLTNLQLLNLSHNKVSQIHLYGFEGLSNLKTLDLSFNMVRYFNDQWFSSLSSLRELYLKGNHLRSINHEPRLNFKNLKILDLSLCAIENLHTDVFLKVPHLEVLDISENFLIHLKVDVIRHLTKLAILVVEGNSFKCKEVGMMQLKNYTIYKGIRYIDPCEIYTKKNRKMEMFQRMQAPNVVKKNGWLYEDNSIDENTTIISKIKEDCNKINRTSNNIIDNYLMEIIELSPFVVISVTIVFGMSIGIVIGCSCQMTGKLTEEIEETNYFNTPPPYSDRSNSEEMRFFQRQNSSGSNYRPRTRSASSRKMMREDRNILLFNESTLSDSTPVLNRKSFVV